jgi:hypothetical protein
MSLDIIIIIPYRTFADLTYYQAAILNIYLQFPLQHTNTTPRKFSNVREMLQQITLEVPWLEGARGSVVG